MAEKEKKEKKEKTEKKKTEKKPSRQLFSKGKGGAKEEARKSDYDILRAPVVTEKSSMLAGNSRSGPGTAFMLKVHPRATKDEIKAAIERIYKVDVIKVNTINYMGKVKRARRSEGRQDKFKKAFVTLKEGQTVNIVEGL
jgi:large subunit ribosomal protein L23